MRILFMSGADWAFEFIEIIRDNFQLCGIVTSPDKPKGRGKNVFPNRIKKCALEKKIFLLQPETLKKSTFLESLRALYLDLIVVVAYGKILPKEVLSIPKKGCVNIHFSLLPRHRGASPIQWALLSGDKKTGISFIVMDEGMDTGKIILQEEIDIEDNDNFLSLRKKLIEKAKAMLVKTLEMFYLDKISLKQQDVTKVTYAPLIRKEDGRINWEDSSVYILRKIRAFTPWPSAYTTLLFKGEKKLLKVLEAEEVNCNTEGATGEILDIIKDKGIIVKCATGQILIKKVRLEGRPSCNAYAFSLGVRLSKGDRFF